MQFDVNALFSAAITAAIAEAIKPMTQQIFDLQAEIAALKALPPGEIDLTSTDFVGAVEAIATRVAEESVECALDEHNGNYDHDDFVREYDLGDKVDEKVAEAIDAIDLDDKVRDAVSGLTFEVSVS